MNLNIKNLNWKEFYIGKIFQIYSTSSSIDKNKLNGQSGNIPYITRTDNNNGYDTFVGVQDERYTLDKKNVITIGLDTQTVFYQKVPFYTGQNIQILESAKLNEYNAKFIITLLKKQMEKFNWGGNGATLTRLKKTKILLPVNDFDEPDYDFMAGYIKQLENSKYNEYVNYIKTKLQNIGYVEKPVSLKDKHWKEFFIEDVANIISGQDIYESERIKGSIPYITATANNNGIGYFVGNSNFTLEKNCLSVNRNGSVGYTFYHHYKALYSNDCRKLRLKYGINRYIGLFISIQITKQKDKYGYGYKMGTGRLKRQKIMLPINLDGTPDYGYMENYTKYLEYTKLQQYLALKSR